MFVYAEGHGTVKSKQKTFRRHPGIQKRYNYKSTSESEKKNCSPSSVHLRLAPKAIDHNGTHTSMQKRIINHEEHEGELII